MEALRRRYRVHPRKLAAEYETHCKSLLRVTDSRQVWCYRDVSTKLRKKFGKMVGLWRCHLALQEIVQLLADRDVDHAHAFAVSFAKALHQVALDRGSWDSAALMIPVADALEEPSFGGSERELAAVHSYRKAMRDLKSKHVILEGASDDDGDEDTGGGGGGASGLSKKQKAAARKKAEEEKKKKATAAAAAAAGKATPPEKA